jgi:hypothetical protein
MGHRPVGARDPLATALGRDNKSWSARLQLQNSCGERAVVERMALHVIIPLLEWPLFWQWRLIIPLY